MKTLDADHESRHLQTTVERAFHEFVGLAYCYGVLPRKPEGVGKWSPVLTKAGKWEVPARCSVEDFTRLREALRAQGWQFQADGRVPSWMVRYFSGGAELVVDFQ